MIEKKDREVQQLVKAIKASTIKPNHGKGLDQVSDRHKRRKVLIALSYLLQNCTLPLIPKICELRDSCEKALWFADSFEIDLASITFKVCCITQSLTQIPLYNIPFRPDQRTMM